MKIKKVFNIIGAASMLAFFIGFAVSFKQLKLTLGFISDNKYVHYKMFRLIADNLKEPLFNMIIKMLLIDLIIILLYLLWTFILSKIIKINIHIHVIDRKKLKILIAAVVCLVFLIFGELAVNGSRMAASFNLLNVILNITILLLTYLLGWIIITKSENILRIIKFKYIVRAGILIVFLFLLFSSIILISAGIRKKSGPNIILIVADCLRADHLGCYGYHRETSPNIDNLAKFGTLFKNAYSSAAWTKPAVASIFTSLYPNKHGVINHNDSLPDEALTIAEILKNSGYRTYFFNGANPYIGIQFNFNQGFDSYTSESQAHLLTEGIIKKLSGLKSDRFFAYIHYMDIHLPYYTNKFNKTFLKNKKNSSFKPGHIRVHDVRSRIVKKSLPDSEKHYLEAIYDGQIKLVDSAVSRIITALKKKKILENTMIIITSDHGEEFWDHNNFEHGHSLYNELIHVPLILSGNKITHSEIKAKVSLIDLLPTILKAARISVNSLAVNGHNLFKPNDSSIFAMGTLYGDEKYCLIKDKLKIILNSGNKKEKKTLIGYIRKEKFELFDLGNDPFEKQDTSSKMPRKIAELKKDLFGFMNAAQPLKSKKISIDKEKELKEKLRSLGYLK